MSATVALTLQEMERIPPCSAHPGCKAIYYCTQDVKCDFSSQGQYCEDCASEDKHNHLCVSVKKIVTQWDQKW